MNNAQPEPEDAKYQISSKREIVALLSAVMKDHVGMSIRLDHMEDTIDTSILRMDDDVMFIKAAADPLVNKALLESSNAAFVANPRNALIKFSAHQIQRVGTDLLALKLDIPDQIVRIQRREFFRIDVPPQSALGCKISFTGADGQSNLIRAGIDNISAGGIGMTDRSGSLPLALNAVHDDCQLELNTSNAPRVRLKTRSVNKKEQGDGKVVHHFGCEFVETPRAALASIQRFIMQLEREVNAQKIEVKGNFTQ